MPETSGHTLQKKERLCLRAEIDMLLKSGRYGPQGQVRCVYRIGNGLKRNRIMVTVPKKHFKRAVKRNLLKRRLREAYRLNKDILPVECGVDVLFIYSVKDVLSQEEVTAAVVTLLQHIAAKCMASDGRPRWTP